MTSTRLGERKKQPGDELVEGNAPKKGFKDRELKGERADGAQGRCPLPSEELEQPQALCWSQLGLVAQSSLSRARQ